MFYAARFLDLSDRYYNFTEREQRFLNNCADELLSRDDIIQSLEPYILGLGIMIACKLGYYALIKSLLSKIDQKLHGHALTDIVMTENWYLVAMMLSWKIKFDICDSEQVNAAVLCHQFFGFPLSDLIDI